MTDNNKYSETSEQRPTLKSNHTLNYVVEVVTLFCFANNSQVMLKHGLKYMAEVLILMFGSLCKLTIQDDCEVWPARASASTA